MTSLISLEIKEEVQINDDLSDMYTNLNLNL